MKSSVMRLILIINQELTWAQGTMNNKWKALSVPFLRKDLLYCNSAFYIALLSLRNMIIQTGLIFISEPRERIIDQYFQIWIPNLCIFSVFMDFFSWSNFHNLKYFKDVKDRKYYYKVIWVEFLIQIGKCHLPPTPTLLRYSWCITLCKFKVCNVTIWYMYILLGDYHSEVP